MGDINTQSIRQDILFEKQLCGYPLKFATTWGLFSPRKIDDGSELLLNQVDIRPQDTSLDIGCGYGTIGLTIAKLSPLGCVHLVDKDYVAIEYAKKNARLNNIDNCKIYLSNAFSNIPNGQFDNIVSNLPAKVGKEMFWIMLADAKKYLKPNGKLYVVTISGLKEFVKRNFVETFGNFKKLAQNKTYSVALATKN